MKVLFIGDVFGRPGREAVAEWLPRLRKKHSPDVVIANVENAAGGKGIDSPRFKELTSLGIDVCTSGNHIWQNKGVLSFIDSNHRLLRPANFSEPCPGVGMTVTSTSKGLQYAVINLMGRVFMQPLDCPFRKADELLNELDEHVRIIIVDMHAEATSEKIALANYLDGRVSAVVGTHTHVQTADERILADGTAMISDVGMTGVEDSIIGVRKDKIIERFLFGRPVNFQAAKGTARLCAVVIDISESTGKAHAIERISVMDGDW